MIQVLIEFWIVCDDLGSLVGNDLWQLVLVFRKGLVSLTCNCTMKESYIQVVNFCIHHRASCFVFRIMLNMVLLLHVVNEGEHMVVNQVAEEVNPSVEVGSNTCETSQELDFSVNEGKP